ncbi:MAG: hypothetical protein KC422_08405 [Trueperaceae bacterium]|nr:hypothetical protein [Trueperaceae bacterium]
MLKVIKGTVSDFNQREQRRVTREKVGDHSIPRTYYETITNFKLDGQQVKVSAGKNPHIAPGDDMVVAGFKAFGEFKGLAFNNLNQNVRWGNNLGSIIFALVLIILGSILSPQRLLQLHIIDIQTYSKLLREASRPFSMWRSLFDILPHIRLILKLVGGFMLLIGLPQLIAYMRIKDA